MNGNPGIARIAAHIGERAHAEPQHLAISIQRQFHFAIRIAAMQRGEEIFHPLRSPAHRAAQALRGKGHHGIFGIKAGFHAKAAANIAHQHAHAIGRDIQHFLAKLITKAGGHLRAHADGEAITSAIIIGQHDARFHGNRRQALVHQIKRHNMCGLCEGSFHCRLIAIAGFGDDIIAGGGPKLRRTGGDGVAQFRHGGQFFVIHQDCFGSITRRGGAFGDDGGDGFTHKTHQPLRQDRARRRGQIGPIRPLEGEGNAKRFQPSRRHIFPGQDRHHTRHGARGAGINRGNACMCMGGA